MGPVLKIGLLGLGTVGTGVFKLLQQNDSWIEKKIGQRLEIKKILVRDIHKPRHQSIPAELLTTDSEDILNDPEIAIVVEVMGGIEPAKSFILQALNNGKNVVTANKDVMALHGRELFEAAEASGKDLQFEASVGGGIPIIHPLKECLAGNRITEVMGIVNGTTNFILSKMTLEGWDYERALAEAQKLGYAEADPTADVEGFDAARKIAILASIAFGTRITVNDVYVEGITKIAPQDLEYAKELGYVIKLLGIAKAKDEQIEVRVHPVFIPLSHPLAAVNDVFNAIFIRGDAVGETMFYGRGAGELPTASAVVGDIIDIARSIGKGATCRIACTCREEREVRPIGAVESKYYLRLLVKNQPGVLASIASVLGNQNVSIAAVIQKRATDRMAEIVLVTHMVKEHNIQDALKIIQGLSITGLICNIIRVEGGE